MSFIYVSIVLLIMVVIYIILKNNKENFQSLGTLAQMSATNPFYYAYPYYFYDNNYMYYNNYPYNYWYFI